MNELGDQLRELCRSHGLVGLWSFGSRAQWARRLVRHERFDATESQSDLDLGGLPGRGTRLDARSRVRLTAALEDLFRVPRVDLVVLPQAPVFLALEAVRGELLVTLDADGVAEYELYVMASAGDLLPYERQRRDAVLREGVA